MPLEWETGKQRKGRRPLKLVQLGPQGLPQGSQELPEVLGFLCPWLPSWRGIRLPSTVLPNVLSHVKFTLVSSSFLAERIITERVTVRILAGLGTGEARRLSLSGLCECRGLNCGPLKAIC